MPTGSCLCGNVKISYSNDPAVKALCHCTDCQKISGSTYSTNAVIPGDGFQSTGSPKTYKKTADSGKAITSYFCGDCGGTLWREAEAFPGMKIVKVGVLDDNGIQAVKPDVELFAPGRTSWVTQIPGTAEKATM